MATPERPRNEGRPDLRPDETSVVLRRAIDLAAERHQDDGEALTEADIAAVARDVGIPGPALAAALAEVRAGMEPQRGIIDRLIGPSKVGASTTLPADEASAAANLRRWLEVEHGLQAYVRQDGVVVASRRGGLPGAIGSGLRRIQGSGGLNRVRSVQAATASTEGDQGVVCVVVDVSNRRTEAVAGGAVVTGGGFATTAIISLIAGPVALVVLPAAVVAGLGTARFTHRRTLRQVEEQVAYTTEAAAQDADPATPATRLLQAGLDRRNRRRRKPR